MKKLFLSFFFTFTIMLTPKVYAQRGVIRVAEMLRIGRSGKISMVIDNVEVLVEEIEDVKSLSNTDSFNSPTTTPASNNPLINPLDDSRKKSKNYINTIDSFTKKIGTTKSFDNKEIKKLQIALNFLNNTTNLNNSNLKVDGLFGKKTITSLNKFHKEKGKLKLKMFFNLEKDYSSEFTK